MRVPHRFFILGILILLVLVCGTKVFLFRPKPAPPLPFDTNAFISTKIFRPFAAPPTQSTTFQRLNSLFLDALSKLPGTTTWSFPASPKTTWGVQPLLNDCTDVTGTRYLMPPEVAAGIVQFGHTNTLDGPQLVAAVEAALQGGDVQWWEQSARKRHYEHLVLLRFPAQKVVVVLPQSAVADFQRTNGIQMPVAKGTSK